VEGVVDHGVHTIIMQPDIFFGLVESKEGIKLALNWKTLLSEEGN